MEKLLFAKREFRAGMYESTKGQKNNKLGGVAGDWTATNLGALGQPGASWAPDLQPQLRAERQHLQGGHLVAPHKKASAVARALGHMFTHKTPIPLQAKVWEKAWYWQKWGLEPEEAREIPQKTHSLYRPRSWDGPW